MALPAERRAALLAAKLAALSAGRNPSPAPGDGSAAPASRQPEPFPGGASLVVQPGPQGWVLADDNPERALGPALAWGASRSIGGRDLHVVVDRHAGLLARQAATFVDPPRVWQIEGDTLVPASAVPPDPSPAPPPAAVELVDQLASQGVEVVIDHGEVIGEVLGLEVARVVVDAEGAAHLEVGVGRNDREAFAIMHADQDPLEALASVAQTVRTHRQVGAAAHPLNRLGAPRRLRARLVAEPDRVGATELTPVPGVLPRGGVKESIPVAAVGTDRDGGPLIVVTSTGIDLALVPAAADLRLAHAPEARLVLVVPERDAHPMTHRLAAALIEPAEVVAPPKDWR